jgi:hypothetical protein
MALILLMVYSSAVVLWALAHTHVPTGKLSYIDVSDNDIRNLTWLNEASGVYTYPLKV